MVEKDENLVTDETGITGFAKLLSRLFGEPHDFIWAMKKVKK